MKNRILLSLMCIFALEVLADVKIIMAKQMLEKI